MTTSRPATVPIIPSVAPLAATTDAWISDIWGVIHNGATAFPAAFEACERFRRDGGTVVLVTNAPFPGDEVAALLDRMGVSRDAWDRIVSSGDVTRALIDAWRGRPIYHLGPDRYLGLFKGLDVTFSDEAAAEAVVCTGLFRDEEETPADYTTQLERLAKRKVPLICVNPDIIVERGHKIVYCAGALAEAYAAIGGPVSYAGKPHLPIYEKAMAAIVDVRGAAVSRERILAIGDGLRTDVAGAVAAGLRCLFIGSALHVPAGRVLDSALLSDLFGSHPTPPVAAQPALVW